MNKALWDRIPRTGKNFAKGHSYSVGRCGWLSPTAGKSKMLPFISNLVGHSLIWHSIS